MNLLFATTIVTFFAYISVYVAIGQAGNGGEYWGWDGFEQPHMAAVNSFDTGDYRFLQLRFSGSQTGHVNIVPGIAGCERHPLSPETRLRPSTSEPMHGDDSVRLARQFAHRYNSRMGLFLNYEFDAGCKGTAYF